MVRDCGRKAREMGEERDRWEERLEFVMKDSKARLK